MSEISIVSILIWLTPSGSISRKLRVKTHLSSESKNEKKRRNPICYQRTWILTRLSEKKCSETTRLLSDRVWQSQSRSFRLTGRIQPFFRPPIPHTLWKKQDVSSSQTHLDVQGPPRMPADTKTQIDLPLLSREQKLSREYRRRPFRNKKKWNWPSPGANLTRLLLPFPLCRVKSCFPSPLNWRKEAFNLREGPEHKKTLLIRWLNDGTRG